MEAAAAPVVARNPHIDEPLIVEPTRGLGGLTQDLALGRRLRRCRFDLAIDFHGGPRASLLTWLSGAPTRIGYAVAARSWMYTTIVDRPRGLRRRHSVLNQWDLLAPLGIEAPTPEAQPIEMPVDPQAAAAVATRLAQAGVTADNRIAVLHVSASSPFRRWPLSAFAETIAALISVENRRVIVTSGPSDRAAVRSVIETARSRVTASERDRILECGEFSLSELRALVERAALYIGGDSGPLHVAAASGVPIVALFGPTPSERSAPWRSGRFPVALIEVDGLECRPCDQRVCAPGDFRCLTGIEPARVIAAAERLLTRTAPRVEGAS